MRPIHHRYQDPIDLVWISTARRLGMEVTRADDVYASWDGERRLTIGAGATLDADDSLAQMILHEICHALVQGPASFGLPDWGLHNVDDRDRVREHACLRLQAALAGRHGLRTFLASTTDYRTYYDALPADPLAGDEDPAIEPARTGFERARTGSWGPMIEQALATTAEIARLIRDHAGEDSLWSTVSTVQIRQEP